MLAIVIPYYKINFFQETLLSLEHQTDKHFNLYIGNDASPENPGELIKKNLQTTSYKYFTYSENLGGKNLVLQWERVINETKEEPWLMILGDDDVLPSNFVEEFYTSLPLLKKHNSSLLKFSQEAINIYGETIRKATTLPQVYSSIQFLEDRLTKSFPHSLSEHIFSREIYYKFKNLPLAWHSDDLAIFEFSNLKNFIFTNKAIVKVRISEYSISGQDNNDIRKQKATYLFCEYLLKHYTKELPITLINLLVKRYREIIWRNGFPLSINITNLYLKKKNLIGFLKSFKIEKELKKKLKSINRN